MTKVRKSQVDFYADTRMPDRGLTRLEKIGTAVFYLAAVAALIYALVSMVR